MMENQSISGITKGGTTIAATAGAWALQNQASIATAATTFAAVMCGLYNLAMFIGYCWDRWWRDIAEARGWVGPRKEVKRRTESQEERRRRKTRQQYAADLESEEDSTVTAPAKL
jgi:hypothetical protein